MAKPNWGKKLKCQSCGAAFYDLNNPEPVCPKCETEYTPVVKSRRGSATPAAPVAKKPAEVAASDDTADTEDILLEGDDDLDDVLDDDDDSDESLIEDTSDLEDDDDMSEIKGNVEVDMDDKE